MPVQHTAAPRTRLFDEIARNLFERIQRGELRPGDQLPPERRLVEEFGVSRTAVREALRSLAARGFVESYVGRGTYVRRPTAATLAERLASLIGDAGTAEQLRAGRVLLEAELAAAAARFRTTEALEALEAQQSGRSGAYYSALASAGGVPVLAPVLTALAAREGALGSDSIPSIVDAIRAQDPDAARAAVRKSAGDATPRGGLA